jgi:hypothetical protein
MADADEETRLLSILGVTAANPEDIERDVIAAVSSLPRLSVLPSRLVTSEKRRFFVFF